MLTMMNLMQFNSENVNKAFSIMGRGMFGIFVVIGLIALVVYLMTRFRRNK